MNYNRITIIGNITKDIILRQTATGKSVINFTVAVNKKKGDKETASFFDCKAYEKTAENISKWFGKGKPIIIEGEMEQENWQNKTGDKHSKLVTNVSHWDFVRFNSDSKKTSSDKPKATASAPVNTPADIDDDLPF